MVAAVTTSCLPRTIEPGDSSSDAVDGAIADTNTVQLTDFDVRVEHTLAHDPLAGATVRLEWSDGRFDEATTNAEGLATFRVDFARGAFDVTAYAAGYSATSLVGVDGALRNALRLFAHVDESATGSVAGHITGRRDANDIVLVVGPDLLDLNNPQPDAFTVRRGLHPEGSASFRETSRLVALEFDAIFDIVNVAISAPVSSRDANVTNVALAFPSPPRTITTSMRPIEWPDRGIVSEASQPQWISGMAGHIEPDRSIIWPVGFNRSSPPFGGRSTCRWQYGNGDPDLLPDHILVGYAMQARQPFTMYVAWSDLAARDAITLPTVLGFELVGTSLDTIRINAAAESATALRLVIGETVTNQLVWIVNAYDPTDSLGFHTPHLPSGVTVASITSRPLTAMAMFGLSDSELRTDFPALPSPVELIIGPTPVEAGAR